MLNAVFRIGLFLADPDFKNPDPSFVFSLIYWKSNQKLIEIKYTISTINLPCLLFVA